MMHDAAAVQHFNAIFTSYVKTKVQSPEHPFTTHYTQSGGRATKSDTVQRRMGPVVLIHLFFERQNRQSTTIARTSGGSEAAQHSGCYISGYIFIFQGGTGDSFKAGGANIWRQRGSTTTLGPGLDCAVGLRGAWAMSSNHRSRTTRSAPSA